VQPAVAGAQHLRNDNVAAGPAQPHLLAGEMRKPRWCSGFDEFCAEIADAADLERHPAELVDPYGRDIAAVGDLVDNRWHGNLPSRGAAHEH
jgi:hypothetical protein